MVESVKADLVQVLTNIKNEAESRAVTQCSLFLMQRLLTKTVFIGLNRDQHMHLKTPSNRRVIDSSLEFRDNLYSKVPITVFFDKPKPKVSIPTKLSFWEKIFGFFKQTPAKNRRRFGNVIRG